MQVALTVSQALGAIVVSDLGNGSPIMPTEVSWIKQAWELGGASLVGIVAIGVTFWRVSAWSGPLLQRLIESCVSALGTMSATQKEISDAIREIRSDVEHIDRRVSHASGVIHRNCGRGEAGSGDSDDELDSGRASGSLPDIPPNLSPHQKR